MRPLSRQTFLLYAAVSAAIAAFVIGHIANADLGLSGGEIRAGALSGAAVIAAFLFAGTWKNSGRGR